MLAVLVKNVPVMAYLLFDNDLVNKVKNISVIFLKKTSESKNGRYLVFYFG